MIEDAGGEASVFGMSSGAVLAAEAAARGVPISRLALYEPPVLVDRDGPEPIPDYIETLDAFVAEDKPEEAMAYFMEVVAEMPPEAVAEFRGSPVWPAFAAVDHTIAYDGRIMDPFSQGRADPARQLGRGAPADLGDRGGDSPDWFGTRREGAPTRSRARRGPHPARPDAPVRARGASRPFCWSS